jgi:thiol-disulfide isomerase/thioredoxin
LCTDVTVQRSARVRAPEFPAGTWLNTDRPLSLRQLRGKVVLLDFWTFCCGNCLHVIDELRSLEHDFADELVIVGVHSPKFEHERSDLAVAAATERYGVAHPVFNDPELHLWRQYAVRAWPTLVLIDPDGYVVAHAAGEGQSSALRSLIVEMVAEHDSAGTLRRGENPYSPPAAVPGDLRFPAKAVRVGDSLWVADAGHHQVVRTDLAGVRVLARIGSGRRGRAADELAEPNGLAALPPEIAELVGFDLVVADTGNHVLRGLRSSDGRLSRTIDLPQALAGTTTVTGPVPDVLSPWDVVWWPAADRLAIAAAGVHLLLGWDPRTDRVEILAGTTVEGLKDGSAADGWLAQPSGLAVDGDRLWFVDAETSALRTLDADGRLHTAVGEGLFDFGHVDGPATQARLQHPLGVTVLDDASVAVADTYNGAIRRYDPVTDELSTLATDLAEPSGVLAVDGELVVVESAAHQLVRPVAVGQLGRVTFQQDADWQVTGPQLRTQRPVTVLSAGPVRLAVTFQPPPGRTLDDRHGPATRLVVSASPPSLLADGSGDGVQLTRALVLQGAVGDTGVLHVSAQAASCDDDSANEHPACHLARQDWGVPVRVEAVAPTELTLVLLG